MKKGDKILITWIDAFRKSGWSNEEDIKDGLKNDIACEIIGYFIKKDKNFIILSMGKQDDPDSMPFLHLEFIPCGAVKKIRKLKL